MITLNRSLIFSSLVFSFLFIKVPNTELLHAGPIELRNRAQVKSVDNNITLNNKECEVITTDHRPETYIEGARPVFTNYFTPKAEIRCKDLDIVNHATLIPIDWIHSIQQNTESLPEAFKKYALTDIPEIPVYAVPYVSKIYPGKSYLVLRAPASLKEKVIKYIQEHKGKFEKEQLEGLPQELKEKIHS